MKLKENIYVSLTTVQDYVFKTFSSMYMQTLLNCLNAYLGRLSKSMIELSFYREFVMAAIIFLSSFLLILRLRIGATGYSPGYTATGPAYSIERVTIFMKKSIRNSSVYKKIDK